MFDDDENKNPNKVENKYPNHIYISIRAKKNCDLDFAAQLTLQPEKISEEQLMLMQA